MRRRVLYPSHVAYERYKDFVIDPRWDKFLNFYEDMGECPEGLTLDRKNNSEGYSKDNCRWATATEQARNRGNNVLNEILVAMIREMGKQDRTKASIARELGVKPDHVCSVLSGRSWKGVAEYV